MSRPLSRLEIQQLEHQGCSCENWREITVAEKFDTRWVKRVHFSGRVTLGQFEREFQQTDGRKIHAGLYDAAIHNCRIADNVFIHRIHTAISNYIIEKNAFIENVDSLVVEGKSAFGNGVYVHVVNEAGGREIPIYENLSAQLAYLIVFYRHRADLIKKLCEMIDQYALARMDAMGSIGEFCRISNCRIMRNVRIGAYAVVEGVTLLENGSVQSSRLAPAHVGHNVIARNFICAANSRLFDGAVIEKCFVGQGCEIGKQFSAENCLFFANSEALHGEACDLFAGPYTVTHHKTTLLIACAASFFNAGSGTNQSNHMYKLGPVHQGLLERGCKTGSSAYLLWPSRVGAFTTIIGQHSNRIDSTLFPFSFLIAHENNSLLVPAVTLKSIGVYRDALKWPKRDRRTDKQKTDRIIFHLFSPVLVDKMRRAVSHLEKYAVDQQHAGQFIKFKNMLIKAASLPRAVELYECAILLFLRRVITDRLLDAPMRSRQDFQKIITIDKPLLRQKWVDVAGLYIPVEELDKILEQIEKSRFSSLAEIENTFDLFLFDYASFEWTFAVELLEDLLAKKRMDLTPQDVMGILKEADERAAKLLEMISDDARKEFDISTHIGYGIDGDHAVQAADFEAVRGRYSEHPHLNDILNTFETEKIKSEKCRRLLTALSHV